MATRVRFRFNKLTGEIEEFLVDDQDRQLPESEHDRIAAEVARMVAVNPGIAPVDDASAARLAGTRAVPHRDAPARERDDERGAGREARAGREVDDSEQHDENGPEPVRET
jgi:FtsH ternary system domain X3